MNHKTLAKSFLVVTAFYLVGIIQSCCDDNPRIPYEITGVELANIDLNSLRDIAPNTNIDYSAYGIWIQFDVNSIAQINTMPRLLNAAVAFDCDETIVPVLHNQIQQAEIQATLDFDSQHKAGTSLNDLFSYRRVIRECVDDGGSLENCGEIQEEFAFNQTLEDILNKSFAQNSYYNSIDERFTNLSLALLKQKPDHNAPIRFILKIKFKDGQELIDTTNYVVLK